MNEAAVRKKIDELRDAIAAVPHQAARSSTTSAKTPAKTSDMSVYISKTSTNAQSIEETLDNLRLQVKYVMFDLEATRRENRYLRQMIDNRRPPGAGDSGQGGGDY